MVHLYENIGVLTMLSYVWLEDFFFKLSPLTQVKPKFKRRFFIIPWSNHLIYCFQFESIPFSFFCFLFSLPCFFHIWTNFLTSMIEECTEELYLSPGTSLPCTLQLNLSLQIVTWQSLTYPLSNGSLVGIISLKTKDIVISVFSGFVETYHFPWSKAREDRSV